MIRRCSPRMRVRTSLPTCHALVLGAFVANLLTAHTAQAQYAPVPGRNYTERLNPTNPVSGEAVVGVAIAGDVKDLHSLRVWMPRPHKGRLRVETLTADGRLRGEGEFEGETTTPGWIELTLMTPEQRSRQQLEGDATKLAVSVFDESRMRFVARWGDVALSQGVRFYVNSRRADVFIRGSGQAIRCQRLDLPKPLRFDSYCDVPLAEIPPDGSLKLIRRDESDEQTQTVVVGRPRDGQ